MMAMHDIRRECSHNLREKTRDGQVDRKVRFIEFSKGGDADDILFVFSLSLIRRGGNEDFMPQTPEFIAEGTNGLFDPTHQREIGIGHHQDLHDLLSNSTTTEPACGLTLTIGNPGKQTSM